VDEIDFSDLIPRSEKVEENVLIDAMFGKIEVKLMYRRYHAILPRNVTPGTTSGQDIQNPVEHHPMVGSGPPDMGFLGREMRFNDRPEIVIDFPECHASLVLFKTPYNCGMTSPRRNLEIRRHSSNEVWGPRDQQMMPAEKNVPKKRMPACNGQDRGRCLDLKEC